MKTLKLFTLSLAALVAMPVVAVPTAGSMEHVVDYATQTVAQVVEQVQTMVEPVQAATASMLTRGLATVQESVVVQAVKAGFTSALNKAVANPKTSAAIATAIGLTGAYLARKQIKNAAYKVASFAKAVVMSPVSLYNWIKTKRAPKVEAPKVEALVETFKKGPVNAETYQATVRNINALGLNKTATDNANIEAAKIYYNTPFGKK